MQACLSPAGDRIATVDKANKIKVSLFPDVTTVWSVFFIREKAEVSDAFFISDALLLTCCKESGSMLVWDTHRDDTYDPVARQVIVTNEEGN